jgi:hypothetical protein
MSALWLSIEQELLNGQKLQGVSTCEEIMRFLQHTNYLEEHPGAFGLLQRISGIALRGDPVETIVPRTATHVSHIEEL